MFSHSFINELFAASCVSGVLAGNHYQRLQQMRQQPQLSDIEASIIDRVFYAVRRGWLQVN